MESLQGERSDFYTLFCKKAENGPPSTDQGFQLNSQQQPIKINGKAVTIRAGIDWRVLDGSPLTDSSQDTMHTRCHYQDCSEWVIANFVNGCYKLWSCRTVHKQTSKFISSMTSSNLVWTIMTQHSSTVVSKLNRDNTYKTCRDTFLCAVYLFTGCYFCWLLCVVVEIALACKIQIQIYAIFDLWYKYGQSEATRWSFQHEYIPSVVTRESVMIKLITMSCLLLCIILFLRVYTVVSGKSTRPLLLAQCTA